VGDAQSHMTRFLPYWSAALAPSLNAGRSPIVAARATRYARWSNTWTEFLMPLFWRTTRSQHSPTNGLLPVAGQNNVRKFNRGVLRPQAYG